MGWAPTRGRWTSSSEPAGRGCAPYSAVTGDTGWDSPEYSGHRQIEGIQFYAWLGGVQFSVLQPVDSSHIDGLGRVGNLPDLNRRLSKVLRAK
jgi:hypothetical protein